jgi:hypothetical protein
VEEWVKVAAAPNDTLALVMKGLLDEAGIPALVQRVAASTYRISYLPVLGTYWCQTFLPAKPESSWRTQRALARGRERTFTSSHPLCPRNTFFGGPTPRIEPRFSGVLLPALLTGTA